MSRNNFMNMGGRELCRFYDVCYNPTSIKMMYVNGNASKLSDSEKQEYHEHCVKGGGCGDLYDNLVLIEKGKPAKVNLSGMSINKEREMENFFFKQREQDSDPQNMKGNESYKLGGEKE